ncbi:helix-turn-helix domain-containing protein [Escherichia coli]|nr:helix-turn-helix domain-containing protein [Escherichia coli]
MANNDENFTPLFKRFIKYTFKNPIAKTTTGKERFHLNLLEMAIYGEMVSYSFKEGEEIIISELSTQTLADDYDVTEKTVRSAIKTLESAGIISIKRSKGKSNIYKLLITPEQFDKMCDAQGIREYFIY